MVTPCELTGGSARKNVLSEQPSSSASEANAGQSPLQVASKFTSARRLTAPRVPALLPRGFRYLGAAGARYLAAGARYLAGAGAGGPSRRCQVPSGRGGDVLSQDTGLF